ncbi:MAG: alcohol dehydrogenase catalytic domain-containing protein, partial [Armatimonadota bacterium]
MKAWFLSGPGELELRAVPDPEPGPNEAVVKVHAVGVCGSDAECFAGKHPLPNYPRLPGHEFSGEVVAAGSAWEGAPIGTRAAVDPALSCGRCYACRQG